VLVVYVSLYVEELAESPGKRETVAKAFEDLLKEGGVRWKVDLFLPVSPLIS
jgi:hypothetical protein